MANERRFKDHILKQYHEEHARVIQLQAVLAQREDQLASTNAQLQRVLTTANASSSHRVPLVVQGQINSAITRAESAENNLKETVARFNRTYAHLTQQNQALRKQNKALRESGSGRGPSRVRAELKRAKDSPVHQKASEIGEGQVVCVPTTATSTQVPMVSGRHVDDDRDDEEPDYFAVKQENGEDPTHKASSTGPAREVPKITAQTNAPLKAASSSGMIARPTSSLAAKENGTPVQSSTLQRTRESPLFVSSGESPGKKSDESVPDLMPWPSKAQRAPMVKGQERGKSSQPAAHGSSPPANLRSKQPAYDRLISVSSDDSLPPRKVVRGKVTAKEPDPPALAVALAKRPASDDEIVISQRPRANAVDFSVNSALSTALNKRNVAAQNEITRKSTANMSSALELASDGSSLQRRSYKRIKTRQSEQEDVDHQLKDHRSTNLGIKSCPTAGSLAKPLPAADIRPNPSAEQAIDDPPPPHDRTSAREPSIQDKFIFKAITKYNGPPSPSASIEYFDSRDDLADTVPELWARTRTLHAAWEAARGLAWPDEFRVKLPNTRARQCVSSKLRVAGRPSGRSRWRAGAECTFACKECVREGRPCFIWLGNEFWLLPLHEDDRGARVAKGPDVRCWIKVE